MSTTSTDDARPRHRAAVRPRPGVRRPARARLRIVLGSAALLVALAAPLLHALLR